MSANTAAPDTRTAPLPLWRSAGAFITTLFNLFGAPQDLAADHTLTTQTHALILSWLRVAEAFLRHLLLIEASALSNIPPPSSRHANKMSARERILVGFDADKPEAWRVSFRCVPSSPARGGSVIGFANDEGGAPAQALDAFGPHCPLSHASRDSSPARGGAKFHSAWPIAERFEALLRVYNNPAPYARRLARRLRALPRLITRVLQTPGDFEHRIDEDTCTQLSAHITPLKPDSS